MDLAINTCTSGLPLDAGIGQCYFVANHGLRSNRENLQQLANLINRLEKLSAELEALLAEN